MPRSKKYRIYYRLVSDPSVTYVWCDVFGMRNAEIEMRKLVQAKGLRALASIRTRPVPAPLEPDQLTFSDLMACRSVGTPSGNARENPLAGDIFRDQARPARPQLVNQGQKPTNQIKRTA